MSSKSWALLIPMLVASTGVLAQTAWRGGTFVDGQPLRAFDLNSNNAYLIGKIIAPPAVSVGGSSGQIQFNNAGVFGGFTVSGDCTLVSSTGAITCLSTNGTTFAPSATTDTTNAANIASGTLSASRLPVVTGGACYAWDSVTTVVDGTLTLTLPWTSGTITTLVGQTGGSGSPSFTGSVALAGTNLTGCNALTVNSTTPSTASCTGSTTWASPNVKLAITAASTSGTPQGASLCVTLTHSPN